MMLFWTVRLALAVLAALKVAFCAAETAQKGRTASAFRQPKEPKEVVCPLNRVAYIVSFNRRLHDFTRLNIAPVSEAQCLSICAKEQHLDGIKLLCSSVTYSARLQRCSVHRNSAKPSGNRQLINDATTTVADEAKRNCKSPMFYRVDNAKLSNAANAINDHQTLTGCLNLCASKKEQCKSVMYLPEEQSCIMNAYSAVQTGRQLHREPRRNVIYLENGCALRNQAKARRIHERNHSATLPSPVSKENTPKKVDQLLPALRPAISVKKLNLPKNHIPTVKAGQKGSQLAGQTKLKGVNLHQPSPVTLSRPQLHSNGVKPLSSKNVFGTPGGHQLAGNPGIQLGSTKSTKPRLNEMKSVGKYPTQNNIAVGSSHELNALTTFGNDHRSNFIGDSGLLRQSQTRYATNEKAQVAQNGAVLLNSPESVVPSESSDSESRFSVSITPVDPNTEKKTTSVNAVDFQKQKSRFSTGSSGNSATAESFLERSPKTSQLPTSTDGMPDETEVTSPWSAWSLCSVFHTDQPCLGEQKLGFQARRCLASPKFCKGPLIRYCALAC
ncbi:PAN 1 domain containing protein [Trichuris trichiura]|uniref:PAN 1 domain containing protein n=1 Tax=Trichuris trichiura TaxID=36087 RepID=A0A077ZBA3_TRITR|nr:PAN 1 domain containing protein [Trichuris trichiura]